MVVVARYHHFPHHQHHHHNRYHSPHSPSALYAFLNGRCLSIDVHNRRCLVLVGLVPGHEVVDDAGPGAVLAPEAEGAVLHGLVGELERHVPHVTVDGAGPVLGQECLPLHEEVFARAGDPTPAGSAEQQTPVGDSRVEVEGALVALLAEDEHGAVDFLEQILVRRKRGEEAREVLFLRLELCVDTSGLETGDRSTCKR